MKGSTHIISAPTTALEPNSVATRTTSQNPASFEQANVRDMEPLCYDPW